MLAYHWRSALELVAAAGQDARRDREHTRLALRAAGDRAFALNAFAAAEAYYAEALELWPEDDSERPDLLFRRAQALLIAADDRRPTHSRRHVTPCSRPETAPARPKPRHFSLKSRGTRVSAPKASASPGRHRSSSRDRRVRRSQRALAVSARYRMLAGERAEGLHARDRRRLRWPRNSGSRS